ncbi:hypothetical protein [Allobranchiibius huperziae]|uniref:Putative HicB family RNase H-like nuclease n=1 Tax=Allobranchiibius huperziae TaxID=1874116 RepID=A0A853DIH3_9MICO|nr:hypothetical protein [Allobranchiibius huperziae]NYJ76588.1 putative HicB family RNase H-like nuclease [Allobranchiibius huperziae]
MAGRQRESGAGFVRVNVSMAPETHVLAKKMAADAGISMALLVEQMMQDEARTHRIRNALHAEQEELPLTG